VLALAVELAAVVVVVVVAGAKGSAEAPRAEPKREGGLA